MEPHFFPIRRINMADLQSSEEIEVKCDLIDASAGVPFWKERKNNSRFMHLVPPFNDPPHRCRAQSYQNATRSKINLY